MRINEILNELIIHYSTIEYIKEIRSGKEASIHLVKADGDFYALKIYKENQKYTTKSDYLQISEIGDSRTARAVENKSKRGRDSLNNIWTSREFKIMRMISDQIKNIPNVYQCGKDFILMEWIGTDENPAPRINEVKLKKSEATSCMEGIFDCIKIFIQNDFVHGDLSAYNILWHKGKPVIIDFPQVLNISNNPNAYEKLKVDLENIRNYFNTCQIDTSSKERAVLEQFHFKRIYG